MKQTCDVQHSQLSLRDRSKIWQYIMGCARHHLMFTATLNDRTTRYFDTIFRRFRNFAKALIRLVMSVYLSLLSSVRLEQAYRRKETVVLNFVVQLTV